MSLGSYRSLMTQIDTNVHARSCPIDINSTNVVMLNIIDRRKQKIPTIIEDKTGT